MTSLAHSLYSSIAFLFGADPSTLTQPLDISSTLYWRLSRATTAFTSGSDTLGGSPLLNCPSPSSALLNGTLHNPTASLILLSLSLSYLTFGLAILWKYNAVRVFNRKIRTANISNTFTVSYFLAGSVSFGMEAFRYAVNLPFITESVPGNGILYNKMLAVGSAAVGGGVSSLALTMAMGHQKQYRSSAYPSSIETTSLSSSSSPSDILYSRRQRTQFFRSLLSCSAVQRWRPIWVLICVCYGVALFLFSLTGPDNEAMFWVFNGLLILQKLPALLIGLSIVFASSSSSERNCSGEGPTGKSKIMLFIGLVFYIPSFFSYSIWSYILKSGCIFYFATWTHFVMLSGFVSGALILEFTRREYERNMEECIWMTVSQIQDSFDFRRF